MTTTSNSGKGAMSELGIPAKLIRLCRMTVNNSCSSVKVGLDHSEPFNTVRGFEQGEPLSCDLFNFVKKCSVEGESAS